MPVVNVKGVGKAKFPDDMGINDIRNFLRNKYSQQAIGGQSDVLAPAVNTASPTQPTLAERGAQGVSDFLFDKGIISDRYGAQQIGKNISAIGEMLPGVGDAVAGDEFGRAAAKGDNFGMAMAGLGVIPVVGDAAKKAIKALPMDEFSRLNRAKEQGFDVEQDLFHGTTSVFDEFDAVESGFNSRSDAPSGVYFMSTNPEVASSYATGATKKKGGKNVLKLLAKKGKSADIRSSNSSTWSQMALDNDLDIDVRDDFLNKNGWKWSDGETRNYPELTDTNEMSSLLKNKGYDSAVFKGISDGKTAKANKISQDTVAIFKPENIRSAHAKFDPENKGKASLLGGVGALSVGGMLSRDEEENTTN